MTFLGYHCVRAWGQDVLHRRHHGNETFQNDRLFGCHVSLGLDACHERLLRLRHYRHSSCIHLLHIIFPIRSLWHQGILDVN